MERRGVDENGKKKQEIEVLFGDLDDVKVELYDGE